MATKVASVVYELYPVEIPFEQAADDSAQNSRRAYMRLLRKFCTERGLDLWFISREFLNGYTQHEWLLILRTLFAMNARRRENVMSAAVVTIYYRTI